MSKQYVVATITADPRHAAEVEAALLAAVPAVRTEDGCEQYDLHQHRGASHRFTMIERWRDEHALKVHGEAPAFQALARALDGKATLDVALLEKLI
ncbi:antibiotic biosynthesis monooxygenase [Burkholderia multivorans]|uniref:putative quinol monooxygenase n=1 Tax=Burkholderia multivorans TaxID=87883 RepID=UPI001C221F26|nr:antibiotic biosynthesis monooxygenase [Burkholderia multivorans]MBU9693220.1 antibiotic biosynthesis monooxygenase [Burkholderia multivorans]